MIERKFLNMWMGIWPYVEYCASSFQPPSPYNVTITTSESTICYLLLARVLGSTQLVAIALSSLPPTLNGGILEQEDIHWGATVETTTLEEEGGQACTDLEDSAFTLPHFQQSGRYPLIIRQPHSWTLQEHLYQLLGHHQPQPC